MYANYSPNNQWNFHRLCENIFLHKHRKFTSYQFQLITRQITSIG
ncbi:hypothetical protein CCAN2_500001 [Capnocytophaga canimorsus]|nr:hypothetical protein CCAN2_500001 [Capnocytophaga canimorsus]